MNAHRRNGIDGNSGAQREYSNNSSNLTRGKNVLETLSDTACSTLRRLRARVIAAMSVALLAPICGANATVIDAVFGGTLNHVDFNGFNLGLSVGDHFNGRFSYDSVTGAALSFSATFGATSFVAHNLHLDADLFDGFLTSFDVIGQLDNGLFMSVGLTNGVPVFTSTPPLTLSSDDWFLAAFKISATDFPPIETGASEIGTIRADYASHRTAEQFFLHTVPEPSAELFFAIGLFAVPLIRKLHRRRGSARG